MFLSNHRSRRAYRSQWGTASLPAKFLARYRLTLIIQLARRLDKKNMWSFDFKYNERKKENISADTSLVT